MTDEYVHPDGGRVYREGDPAHRFALLAAAVNQMAAEFQRHYKERMADRDYLGQTVTWPSDPSRIARTMADTIAALDQAYTEVIADRDLPDYGLGKRDDEWARKYAAPPTP